MMDVITNTAIAEAATYNEAMIRFQIIDPIIRKLGYGVNGETYFKLEENLPYPYFHIGRRSKKDVPLGKADYRAGVKGARGSFVVEAKAGNVPLTQLEIEQAHSYAAHAQVGANYFVLCNGLEFRVYETLSGHDADPIILIPISRINELYYQIENILSPDSIIRNCKVEYDRKMKLCAGLNSAADLIAGVYRMDNCTYRLILNGQDKTEELRANLPQIQNMDEQLEMFKENFELRVEEGRIARDEDGRINAYARMAGVTLQNKAAMKIMGIDEIWFTTSEQCLSTDSSKPTMFEAENSFSVANGTEIPFLFRGSGQMAGDVNGELFIKAAMHFDGRQISGRYISNSHMDVKLPMFQVLRIEMDVEGGFLLHPNL